MAITFPTQTQLKNLSPGVDPTDAATVSQLSGSSQSTLLVSSNPTGNYTINTTTYNKAVFSSQSNTITFLTSGTATSNQTLWVSLIGAATITFSSTYFETSTAVTTLPTSVSGRIDIGFVYNTNTNKWRCVAVA